MENEILAGIVTTYDVIKALAESNGAVNKYPTEV
jgi:CBS domain-containing protein